VIRLLVTRGADVNAKNRSGYFPRTLASGACAKLLDQLIAERSAKETTK
jgi:hypothetical protein